MSSSIWFELGVGLISKNGIIHSDSNGNDGKDILYAYEGCGCAGGQITTVQGELVPRNDQPNVNARRTQKIYADILGRTKKTEILNWDNSVYTTTMQTFNGRDQVLQTTQYAGAEGSSTHQDVTMTYDGHGRMKTRHYPIEDSGATTSWIYNTDDSIQQVIDPRNAITTFSYNSRGLMNQISYGVPSPNPSNITTTPTVNFNYDAFSQMTQRQGEHWGDGIAFSENYTNGRINNFYGSYDASGNVVQQGDIASNPNTFQNTTFDASGRRTVFFDSFKGRFGNVLNTVSEHKTEQLFDGDGRPVVEKIGTRNYHVSQPPSTTLTAEIRTYQVWSSVLGSSLTAITASGNKLETKIFAGNALIAKQFRYVENNQTYDRIEWRTADPVTGTVGVFAYNSQGGGFNTEENEPLGQKVNKDDPQDQPDPIFETRFGSADDPEWQCQERNARFLFGSFTGRPIGCQMKILQDLSIPLKDTFSWKEESVILLNWNRQKPINIPNGNFDKGGYAISSLRNAALTSTSKKIDIGEVGYVEVKGSDLTIDFLETSVVSAEFGEQLQTKQSGPTIEAGIPANIRDLVSELAKRPDCADILEKIADKLGASSSLLPTEEGKTFIETVFDSMKKLRIHASAGSGATTDGSNINLNLSTNTNQTFVNGYYAKYVLQELVHNFKKKGQFSDSALDKAALQILDEIDPSLAQSERDRKKQNGFVNGTIAHRLINQSCQYSQKEMDENGK